MKLPKILPTVLLASLLLLAVLMIPKHAAALSGSDFSGNNIIDDSIFYNSTMTSGQIQAFLNAKVPTCDTNGTQASGHAGYATRVDWGRANGAAPPYTCLKNYTQSFGSQAADTYCNAITGTTMSAANIISTVAQACSVSPQALLVLLQKEQGLVTDDWPWPAEYQSATGYGCPDTAACDSTYYGFFNQVYNAAHQFERYVKQPASFNYKVGQKSYVQYNPSSSCGGTNLTLLTRSTAALYNYTPYQPNQAALNNLYGTGDGCSSYGNRNFWRTFNDWFGTTKGTSFSLVMSTGGATQYVLCNGTLYSVGSLDMLYAWGLDKMGPAAAIDPAYINSLPVGATLSRLVRPDNSWALYLVDGGNKWVFPTAQAIRSWGFDPNAAVNIPGAVVNSLLQRGQVGYSVQSPSDSRQFMMDGGTLRSYGNVNILKAWEGEVPAPAMPISSTYFNSLTVGSALSSFKFTAGSQNYLADSTTRLSLNSDTDALYNLPVDTVSQSTVDRLTDAGQASQFVRQTGTPTMYIVDNGQKRAISGGPVYANAYASGWDAQDMAVDSGHLAILTSGADFNSSLVAQQGSQYYLIDGRKIPISSAAVSGYSGGKTIPVVNTHLLNLLPTAASSATQFIRASGSPTVYMLDYGTLRSVESAENFVLWGGPSIGVTVVDPRVLTQFSAGAAIGNFISNNGTIYLVNDGTSLTVDTTTQTNWGLSNPQSVASSTLAYLTSAGSLPSKVKVGSSYYLIRNGKAYQTTNPDVATLWGINNAVSYDPLLMRAMAQPSLSRFLRSTDPSNLTVYVIETNAVIALKSVAGVYNLGYGGEEMVQLPPSELISRGIVSGWDNVMGKDGTGTYYVFDGGVKHRFSSTAAQNQWTNNGSYTAPTFSNSFLNMLPTSSDLMGESFRANEPAVYAVVNGVKRHVDSPYTAISYGPATIVSTTLRDTLLSGPDIP